MEKVKFGIIGTGMIAQMHADALRLAENAELVAVYDKVVERAEKFAADNKCAFAARLEELVAMPVEAVTIAVPSGLHGEVAIAAAKSGKHILMEM